MSRNHTRAYRILNLGLVALVIVCVLGTVQTYHLLMSSVGIPTQFEIRDEHVHITLDGSQPEYNHTFDFTDSLVISNLVTDGPPVTVYLSDNQSNLLFELSSQSDVGTTINTRLNWSLEYELLVVWNGTSVTVDFDLTYRKKLYSRVPGFWLSLWLVLGIIAVIMIRRAVREIES